MLRILTFSAALLFQFCTLAAQTYNPVEDLIQKYLSDIRQEEAFLYAFFQQMPKGGDIHHHYSGAVYAESFAEHIAEKNYWVNTQDYRVEEQRPRSTPLSGSRDTVWRTCEQLRSAGLWGQTVQRLVERWSVLGYRTGERGDQYFFGVFPYLNSAVSANYAAGLREIRRRAISEQVLYIETIFEPVQCNDTWDDLRPYETALLAAQTRRDTAQAQKLIAQLMQQIRTSHPAASSCISQHNAFVRTIHENTAIDDEQFTLRYQNYALRMLPPTDVFAQLYLCFASAATSPLIVGVNLVGPENDPVALRDCWLHHQFFAYLHTQFPNVRIALHAGELTTRIAPAEELTWHVRDAIYTAKAQRIGHCASIAHEQNSTQLMRYMAENNIVAEINLTSNEFILNLTGSAHPIQLLHHHRVPLVIATDDAGILRTSLTQQYVLLAQRYPKIHYRDIKKIAYNSLQYAFLEDENLRKKLTQQLDEQFRQFEKNILAEITPRN